jgi:hypothetical protein
VRRRGAAVPTGRPIGSGDRVMAGLSVAFDASCEEMWLAWADGACLFRARGRWCGAGWTSDRGGSPSDHDRVDGPTLVALWPPARWPACAADPRRRGVSARAGAHGWRSDGREVMEHLRSDRGDRRRVRRPPGRDGPVRIGLPLDGWDLAVSCRERCRCRRRGGRADHRRGRARPLPRPGEGRREVRPMPSLGGNARTAAATW